MRINFRENIDKLNKNPVFEKTYNRGYEVYTSLYGSCVDGNVHNINLLSYVICDYFDYMGANKSKINGIREVSGMEIKEILEVLYDCSTYNCTNTPMFSAMLEVAYAIDDKKAIDKLSRIVNKYEKNAMNEPSMISRLRTYYDKEF